MIYGNLIIKDLSGEFHGKTVYADSIDIDEAPYNPGPSE